MLLSMTGIGDARIERDGLTCQVDIRSVNNRFLKVVIKLPDSHARLDPEIERFVRDRVRRGSVTATIRLARIGASLDYHVDRAVLEGYLRQLEGLADRSTLVPALLGLPGVVREELGADGPEQDWPLIRDVLEAAIERFQQARRQEGTMMQDDLEQAAGQIGELAGRIEARLPAAISAYRDRLVERVNTLLVDRGITLEPKDLVREVALYVERSDIAEELARLKSHLAQLRGAMASEDSAGRKLEFLGQEMYREANTIGSKAADIAISQWGMDLKGHVERIRELVQNVE